MPSYINLIGQRFGRWTVISRGANYVFPSGSTVPRFLCRCDCGNEKEIKSQTLRDGTSKSCGCLNAEVRKELCIKRNTTHGAAAHGKSAEYKTWQNMLSRCRNPNCAGYRKYGARGIKVCERWDKFEHFLADMGEKPSANSSIERINPFGGYEPSNCCWIDKSQQPFNKTNTRIDSLRSLRALVKNFCDAHNVPIEEFAKSLTP